MWGAPRLLGSSCETSKTAPHPSRRSGTATSTSHFRREASQVPYSAGESNGKAVGNARRCVIERGTSRLRLSSCNHLTLPRPAVRKVRERGVLVKTAGTS